MNRYSKRRQRKMDSRSETKKATITVLCWILACATLRGCFADVPRFSESAAFGLGSTVVLPVHGDVFPHGYYWVVLRIGHPPKAFAMDIDTGSDLSWVQCEDDPCTGCTLPVNSRYKPDNNFVDPEDPLCAASQRVKTPGKRCPYKVAYADGSSSYGALVNDSFDLKLRDGSLQSPFMVFGCGYEQEYASGGPPSYIAGVLGLGNGRVSILSQLSGLIRGGVRNVVSHCLGSGGGGFLFLGDYPASSSKVVWVPISADSSAKRNGAGPAELLHNNKSTGVRGLGVAFDSGSSYTYFNRKAYEAVLEQIGTDLKGTPLDQQPVQADLPVCWTGAKDFTSVIEVKTHFKPFALSFTKEGSLFQLLPEAYLIIIHGKACLGILSGEKIVGELNVIGDISMLDRMVIYDNEKKRIGWVAKKCDDFGSSELSEFI